MQGLALEQPCILFRLHNGDEIHEVVGKVVLLTHFGFFFLKMPVFLSALLNSLATAGGTPVRLANLGLCAAAAINRAWAGLLLGISFLLIRAISNRKLSLSALRYLI